MALQITGQAQIFQATSQKSGSPAAVSTGWHNELLMTELLPRYMYAGLAGKIFHGSLTASAALVAAGTAAGPFTLFNPATSQINAVLTHINVGLGAVPAAGANEVVVQLATTVNGTLSATTPGGKITNGNLSSASGQVQLLTAATISSASTPIRNLGYLGDVATTSVMENGQIEVELAGSIVLPPGAFVCLIGLGATPANFSVVAGATWIEIPA